MSNFGDVGQFHHRFGLPSVIHDGGPGPKPIENGLLDFRIRFLEEELDELKKAAATHDHEEMADALIDLTYIAMGTAHFLGYPWEAHWREVQAANMRKVRGSRDGSQSKRHSPYDVIKPEGWVGPDHKTILQRYGFDV